MKIKVTLLTMIIMVTMPMIALAAETELPIDPSFITKNYMPIVVLACLVVGFIIKHTKALDNLLHDYIPLIVGLVGAILGCINAGISLNSIVFGAVSGLAASGAQQAFSRMLNKTKEIL